MTKSSSPHAVVEHRVCKNQGNSSDAHLLKLDGQTKMCPNKENCKYIPNHQLCEWKYN